MEPDVFRKLLSELKGRLYSLGMPFRSGLSNANLVYCKDDRRRGGYLHEKFDFLGFTFRPRTAKTKKGVLFVTFTPAVSNKALRKMNRQIRSWKLHLWNNKSLEDLAHLCNPSEGMV